MNKTLPIIMCLAIMVILASCESAPSAASQGSGTVGATGATVPIVANAQARYSRNVVLTDSQRYTVVRGDTLTRISRARYNNGYYYPLILMANGDLIRDPDRILPGMVITIPNLQRNLNNAAARADLRAFILEMSLLEEQRGRARTATQMRTLARSL